MSFDQRAATWDASDRRQALARAVADAILHDFSLDSSMRLLDFGAGTGLLTRGLLPHVDRVVAVDTSEGMLKKFRENFREENDRIETVHGDITAYRCTECYDGVVSSMTMHHVPDTEGLLRHLFALLKPGGFLAVADLMPEDGSFHDHGNDGVHHFGFEVAPLLKILRRTGFTDTFYRPIFTVEKDPTRRYGIFLLGARKPLRR